jgi:EH domain-containing protein 1
VPPASKHPHQSLHPSSQPTPPHPAPPTQPSNPCPPRSFNAGHPIREDVNPTGRSLFEREQEDLLHDLYDIPARSCDRRVNEFVKRVRWGGTVEEGGAGQLGRES